MKDDKRKDYITWDGYFMGIATIASFRSKDPNTQNGACIVDPIDMIPLSIGYNGFPRNCEDDSFPWARHAEKEYDTKYPYVEHAERNSIYSAARKGIKIDGSVIYLYSEKGYYPCSDCARAIIQAGIKEVIMASQISDNTDKYDWTATKRMFKASGVKIRIIENVFIIDSDMISGRFKQINRRLRGIEDT